ncbi:4-hydroxythreonine-4-phosphate dehydrogenase PdxA [Echinicola vietnamensis]|uniref:4-hydroxythreonine-4-phosphate dehydrogenase n=1 Tax=Echinicola vietnamensis (strain DSM 17526 / LMG 23754 / KMM 6221) TaxID=926556 RepID=L0FWR6_ECHVK|nr:4-hydroxythreonine-4-phosphate dehydrogenase PdxA [Echinicola vietnamensis]AGA77196.1 4-hydroxythreonine-4-phosphate dehydrogenase [Echinicola vietnamensis DSM 17526]
MERPIIAITMGDPAGIGPEIIVKSFRDGGLHAKCKPLVVGDATTIAHMAEQLQAPLTVKPIETVQAANFDPQVIEVLDLKNVDHDLLEMGKVSAMAGAAAFQSVKRTIELALAEEVDATVTSPINKESINLAGHHYAGHTEIYAEFTGTEKFAMLLVEQNLRVIHVTTHVPLRQACDLVKKDRVLDVVRLLHHACVQFGIESPRIGVAGLNPHAGDGGLFGTEDDEEILPAVQAAKAEGFEVEGPVPPDTLFAKAVQGYYDGCVAMYHDQGHIPFKMVGFKWNNESKTMESVKGVNITLGLPIIRTSVDHGTAFEIAGQGIASEDALNLAIDYAIPMAKNRKKHDSSYSR